MIFSGFFKNTKNVANQEAVSALDELVNYSSGKMLGNLKISQFDSPMYRKGTITNILYLTNEGLVKQTKIQIIGCQTAEPNEIKIHKSEYLPIVKQFSMNAANIKEITDTFKSVYKK